MVDDANPNRFSNFSESHVSTIGEIRFDHSTKHFAVFGVPEYFVALMLMTNVDSHYGDTKIPQCNYGMLCEYKFTFQDSPPTR